MDDSALAWLPRFLTHLSVERRLSAHTDTSYRGDLQRFVAYCDRSHVGAWRAVDSQHVRMFAAAEFRQGSSPRTIQRRLSALRSFFNFMLRERALDANPAVGVQAPKARKRLPETMDVDLMARLLEFRTDTQLGVRDKAIMELFYSSGLRLAELVGLNLGDVDRGDRTVRVLGKGSKTRIVPVGKHALDASRALAQRALDPCGGRRTGAVRQQSRRAAGPTRDSEARRGLGAAPGPRPPRSSAPVPSLVRDTLAGIQPGPARCAGIARAREHRDDAGLHAP